MTEKYVIFSKNLIRQHAVALVFIVFFSTLSWLNHELLIRTQQEITLTANVCESLRMLGQRTTLFANLLVNAPEDQKEELRNKLSDALFLMERSHRALTLGDQNIDLSGKMSPTIYVLYSEGNNPVNNLVQNYIKEVKAFLKLTGAQITGESSQLPTAILLDALDKMVEQYQVEGDSSIRRINDFGRILWLTTFLLLSLEIVLIFKLFAKDLKAVIARLEEVSNKLTFHRNHLEELVLERTEELRENHAFTQDILDSVVMEIAVLDQAGKIVAVNEAWTQFAINNGLEPEQIPLRAGIGCNYLEVCGKGVSQEILDTAQGNV